MGLIRKEREDEDAEVLFGFVTKRSGIGKTLLSR